MNYPLPGFDLKKEIVLIKQLDESSVSPDFYLEASKDWFLSVARVEKLTTD